jgi:hypothetical protein
VTWSRRLRRLVADIAPLRTSRDFRLLFASRTVTLFGSLATEVALLVQARQLTGSAAAVGLLGAVELAPLVAFGLYGGALTDRLDRRRYFPASSITAPAPRRLRAPVRRRRGCRYDTGPDARVLRPAQARARRASSIARWKVG